MSVPEFPGDEFAFEVGQVVTRADISREYGTAGQSGIEAPKDGNNVFIHSSPERNLHHGYNHDGALDPQYNGFDYTGAGRLGDQELARGNKTLEETRIDGRIIRLMLNSGTQKRGVEQHFIYRGAYRLRTDLDTSEITSPDKTGQDRKVFVFHLERLAPVVDSEATPLPETRRTEEPLARITRAEEIPAERASTASFVRSETAQGVSHRAERALEQRFISASIGTNDSARRLRIAIAGERGYLFTDTWVPETRELVEAKQSASRANVRVAIGQLLDYARFIEPRPTTLTVLTPEKPRPDLVDFIRSQGMTSAFFEDDTLIRLTP